MRALVIGAGKMGRAIALDLSTHGFEVTVADADLSAASRVARELGRAAAMRLDAADHDKVLALMRGQRVAVSAVPYFLNEGLARTAVEAGVNFVDLGGNSDVVRRELALDRAARKRGVCVVPDCGLAPGLVSFLTARGIEEVGRPRRVRIRVGGLPQKPVPPLNYQLVFSVHGLINEYSGWCETLRKGRLARSRAMTGVEELEFPPLGTLEAFHTSGGSSTLPRTFQGKVHDLDYKTLRYPGHCALMRALMRSMSREELYAHLEKTVPARGKDLVAVLVEVDDWKVRLLDRGKNGLSAMMRTTGFPAAVVATLVARGQVRRKGALIQERDFRPREVLDELEARGLGFSPA